MTSIPATTLKILESLSDGKAHTGVLDTICTSLTAEETDSRLHELKAAGQVTFRELSADGEEELVQVVELKITKKGQNTLAQHRP